MGEEEEVPCEDINECANGNHDVFFDFGEDVFVHIFLS